MAPTGAGADSRGVIGALASTHWGKSRRGWGAERDTAEDELRATLRFDTVV